ncbi:transcriptional repressor LexA [Patescibacteria group bacterium]|nr:transcriptional repressor LexA [Patescibacteria group bacterium]
MKLNITERQKQTLSIIYDYIKSIGYPPTFEEMKDRLNVSSNQSVIDLLNKLEDKKIIKRNQSGARGIAILPFGYEVLGKPPLAPFLGVSHAGSPLTITEISGQWQRLPGNVARLEDEVFLIKVSGDSMINAGIEDGDVVLVQKQKEFVSGDIVLARIGDDSTIKRFISEDKPPYLYLKPENPKYDLIYFTKDVRLEGKVIRIMGKEEVRLSS